MEETMNKNSNADQSQAVWRDIKEVPDSGRELVFFDKKGHLFAPYYAPDEERWRLTCIIIEAVQWAYADDLKPQKK